MSQERKQIALIALGKVPDNFLPQNSFVTRNRLVTVVHSPVNDAGKKQFIKDMASGAAQADCAIVMVSAKTFKEDKDMIHQDIRLADLIGIKQFIVVVDMTSCSKKEQKQINEDIREQVSQMFRKLGHNPKKLSFVNMALKRKQTTLEGCAELMGAIDAVKPPKRDVNKPFMMPVSEVLKIKGVGDVITGRIEQGTLKPGMEVKFLKAGCTGRVRFIEMHHKNVDEANAGDNVGLRMKGLTKDNMPKKGDVMVLLDDIRKVQLGDVALQ